MNKMIRGKCLCCLLLVGKPLYQIDSCLPTKVLQALKAHVRDSFAGPLQVVPLFAGGGLVHDRLRC